MHGKTTIKIVPRKVWPACYTLYGGFNSDDCCVLTVFNTADIPTQQYGQ
jgi:hypothetical protein